MEKYNKNQTQNNTGEDNGNENSLNLRDLVFMVITMAGMLTYFLLPAYKNAAFIAMIIAVVIKFIEVALRMFHK